MSSRRSVAGRLGRCLGAAWVGARAIGRAVAHFWRKAYEDNLTGLAGMVAYNLLLSLFPLALIALFIAGRVLASPALEHSVLADLRSVFPGVAESRLSGALRDIRSSSTSVGILALVASVWVGASFWGALDTAFCRIYHLPCRGWVAQKLFALGMLAVVLMFFAATVTVPTLQSLLAANAKDLPFGLSGVGAIVYGLTLLIGITLLFLVLCAIYRTVPNGPIPWRGVWPGALGATLAMTLVDYSFPLYLAHVSTLASLSSSLVFMLIALLWFYAMAIILLAGAVINELRVKPNAPGMAE